jgi:hypothetical protein
VHIAARIVGQAGAGEILVSRTVRDLVVGSGTGFEDRGSVELRGVPGTWQLLAIDRNGPAAGSAEAELASTPTPGPQASMRRSDRAVAVMARQTPWILRGAARIALITSRRSNPRHVDAAGCVKDYVTVPEPPTPWANRRRHCAWTRNGQPPHKLLR